MIATATATVPRGIERRADPRVKAMCLVTYRDIRDGPPEIEGLAATIDLSQRGMKLWMTQRLAVRSELSFRLALRDDVIYARGRVVYTVEIEPDRFIAGIRLKHLAEGFRDRLKKFLKGRPRLTPASEGPAEAAFSVRRFCHLAEPQRERLASFIAARRRVEPRMAA